MAFAGVSVDDVLLSAMRAAELNHTVIANNIANVDTPGYTPTQLDFQKTLRETIEGRGSIDLRTSRPRHLDLRSHRPQFEGLAFLSKNDYNKVDLDEEIARLSENTGNYTTYSSIMGKRLEMVKGMLSSLNR